MSYDIIYNKQFVRLRRTGEVIPMMLIGPSNCFEIAPNGGNGRRTRSWYSFSFYNRKGKLSEKPDVLLHRLDSDLNRVMRRQRGTKAKHADILQHFGYYTSIAVGGGFCGETSWSRYRNQFANGIKHAMTVEELYALGVTLHFDAYPDNDCPARVPICTERQYFAELKKWREWRDRTGNRPSLSFGPYEDMVLRCLLEARKPTQPRPKTEVRQDHYYVLANDNGYLRRYTRNGYRYGYHPMDGRRFRTEREADRFRQSLIEKRRHQASTWRVQRVNSPTVFLAS